MKNITAKMKTLSIFELFKKYNIKPSKRLGQNFLINENVLGKIIESAELSKNDTILEIGPGLGILTIELAKKVKRVTAIEKDKRFCDILKENLKDYKNVEIINADILNTRYKIQNTKYKIVANIPYYLTSPLIRKFLEAENKPSLMILMVQKEVAQRICAKPPKMSLLSVAVQFYAEPEIITYVSKKSFYPQPKVDSAILRIEPLMSTNLNANERKYFFELVKAGFSSKRKYLINNLSREFKIQNSKFKILFEQVGLAQKCRAENLSINDWIKVFHSLNIP